PGPDCEEEIDAQSDKVFQWKLLPPTPRSRHGRAELQIPWRGTQRPDDAGNSDAIKRSRATERRLSPAERGDFLTVIKGLITSKYGQVVESGVIKHIIPSFPVVRHDHITTKTRLVCDGSTQLNALCFKGRQADDTVYAQSLSANLIMFRSSECVVVDDIKQAFHQVSIPRHEAAYFGMVTAHGQHLLFWIWLVMLFGTNYAPSALMQSTLAFVILADYHNGHLTATQTRALDEVASQIFDDYCVYAEIKSNAGSDHHKETVTPDSHDQSGQENDAKSNTIPSLLKHTSMYVDDTQSRAESPNQALQVADALNDALGSHGMPNNPPKRHLSWEKVDCRYLGYRWKDDYIAAECHPDESVLAKPPGVLTRRHAHKLIGKYFDPLGIGVEISSTLRMYGRLCHLTSTTWDSP
ncbi:hypothetical protein FOZ62_010141, partial [Perkinsus olseni]